MAARRYDRLAVRALLLLVATLAACSASPPPVERRPLAIPPLPEERHGHRAEFLGDGTLLVFGGFDDADRAGDRGGRATWRLDPARGAWSRQGDLRRAMHFHGSTTLDGAAIAVGGDVERFDPARAAWEVVVAGERMPRSHFAAAAMGARVIAAGGFENRVADLADGSVVDLPDYPGRTPQDHFAFVAALDGALHVAGGYGGESFDERATHWAWDGATWTPRAPLPRPLSAKFAAWAADPDSARILVFHDGGGLAYDARADAWIELAPPPWTGYLAMPACALRDGYLYVLGGEAQDERRRGVHVYDARADVWLR